jgi:AcrR family transcriptional regulator
MDTKLNRPSPAKDKIINVAMRLFNAQGVHGTGIEQIIAESEVAKMTFYKHFPSKSKLIEEYLRKSDDFWFQLLSQHTSKKTDPATERILSIFDGLQTWFIQPDFHGCPFIRGLADFNETEHKEAKECVAYHFNKTGDFLLDLLKQTKIKNPESLVPPLLSLIMGAIVMSNATKSPSTALYVKETGRILLQNAEGQNRWFSF